MTATIQPHPFPPVNWSAPECGHTVIFDGRTGHALDGTLSLLTCTLPAGHEDRRRHHDQDAASLDLIADWVCPATCSGGREAHYADGVEVPA
jgi:hypothetical protein